MTNTSKQKQKDIKEEDRRGNMKAWLFRKGYKGPANVWEFKYDKYCDNLLFTTQKGVTYYIVTDPTFEKPIYVETYAYNPNAHGYTYIDVTSKLRCVKIVFENGAEYYFKGRK